MSKYVELKQFLQSSRQDFISMHFSEIERILGFELPGSAYTHNAWWANGGHSHANTWLDAGYNVEYVNPEEETVSFCKRPSRANQSSQSKLEPSKAEASVHTSPMSDDSTEKALSIYDYELFSQDEEGNILYKTIPTLNLLNNNKLLLENIEKSNHIIQEIHNDQIALYKELNSLKIKNTDLKNTLKETEKEKNSYIIKQESKLKKLERSNRVLLSKNESLSNELNKINSVFNSYKTDKSDEISSLNKKIESLKEEREKDKKVLAEFENVIKVLDKIKGVFSKD